MITAPPWLKAPPDQRVDHRYLDADEIAATADGVFYKKKATLTRHRFAKATFQTLDDAVAVEVIDNRGAWQIAPDQLAALSAAAGASRDVGGVPGVPDIFTGAPPREGIRPAKPNTLDDIIELYANYTDMADQGHFDDDSPDLERLDGMVALLPPSGRVLDIGCNSGAVGARISATDYLVCGVDIARPLLRRASTGGTFAVRALAERLPFRSGAFDAVVLGEVLEHVIEPLAVLGEARRVLAPSGVLVGSVPHAAGQWGTCDLPFHPEHLWAWDAASLGQVLGAAGFALLGLVEQRYTSLDVECIVFSARVVLS